MTFVLDASATLAWAFEDEAKQTSWALLARLREEEALVPVMWPFEVGNALASGERRGRVNGAKLVEFIAMLAVLPIQIEGDTADSAFTEVLSLARREDLSTYDASYLFLALRRGVALATRDRALAAAARRMGVTLLPA